MKKQYLQLVFLVSIFAAATPFKNCVAQDVTAEVALHRRIFHYSSKLGKLKEGEWVASKFGEYAKYDSVYIINDIPFARFSNSKKTFDFDLSVTELPTTKNALDYGLLPYYSKQDALGYIKKFGSHDWSLILRNQARIGMTKEMITMSLGEPFDVNKTTSASGVREQWVYVDTYVYFNGNKVTAIQDF